MKARFILLTILLGVASYSPLVRAQSRGTFIGTASMATARSFHTATLLLDGRVLIAGGGNNFEAGAYDAVVSPGCLIGFFGSNLAVAPVCANGAQSPTTLGGVSLTVAGLPAPLLYVVTGTDQSTHSFRGANPHQQGGAGGCVVRDKYKHRGKRGL